MEIRTNFFKSLLKKTLIRNEGMRTYVYLDSRGFPTAGIGHKLTAEENKRFKLKQAVTMTQVNAWFENDMATAEADARSLVGNFDALPIEVQVVVVDMAFNMGKGRLSKFKRFMAALAALNFDNAVKEMRDSDWFRSETHNRAVHDISIITNRK